MGAFVAQVAPTGVGRPKGIDSVALSEIDRNLLERCIERKPRAWEDFVDRFMGLVVHVANHTAQTRSVRLSPEDRDDLCAEVFLNIIKDDHSLLRHFRGQSSLATYLTVVARRIVVRKLFQQKPTLSMDDGTGVEPVAGGGDGSAEQRISNREEVQRLLEGLSATEARIVCMYHLEGNSYRDISSAVGVPENSIGPILTRARSKMRDSRANPATS
jgi:RNA polymerase sigma-70 factor (ECF subfamily)